jgi:hypothetical protein
MTHVVSDRFPISFSRGIAGAGLAAVCSAAVGLVVVLVFLSCRWLITGANEVDRRDDIQYASEYLPEIIVFCAFVAGCAGWAAAAPTGRHGFATSLATVVVATVSMWLVVDAAGLRPRRYKGMEDDPITLPEATYIVGPPLLAGAILTLVRSRTTVQKQAEPSDAADSR